VLNGSVMHEIIPEGVSLPILGTGSYAQE